MKLRYSIDSTGLLIAVGYVSNYDTEITNEPFGINDAGKWRLDQALNEWVKIDMMYVPQQISKLQCVKHLLDTNRYNDLMSALDADTTGVSRILFDAASTLSRDSNMVNQLATALGFSNEDTDAFFVEAEKIIV